MRGGRPDDSLASPAACARRCQPRNVSRWIPALEVSTQPAKLTQQQPALASVRAR